MGRKMKMSTKVDPKTLADEYVNSEATVTEIRQKYGLSTPGLYVILENYYGSREKIPLRRGRKKASAPVVVETVTQVVDALETTELPVDALVEPAVEDQLAMLLPQTANTKPVAEPQASINIEATTSPTVEAESDSPSKAVLLILLCVLCTAVAGVVICLKKKRV